MATKEITFLNSWSYFWFMQEANKTYLTHTWHKSRYVTCVVSETYVTSLTESLSSSLKMWHTRVHMYTYTSSHMHTHTHTVLPSGWRHCVIWSHVMDIFTHAAHVHTYNHLQLLVWPLFHYSCLYSFIHAMCAKKYVYFAIKCQVRVTVIILWYITRCRCSSAWDCDKYVLVWLNVAISMQIFKLKCCSNLYSAPN